MRSTNLPGNDQRRRLLAGALILGLWLLPGCGGGGGGGGGNDAPNPTVPTPSPAAWEQAALHQVTTAGLTNPAMEATVDNQGLAHILFFEESGSDARPYGISYLEWDPAAAGSAAVEAVVEVDTCNGLAAASDAGGQPIVLYQGGQTRACGAEQQSDAMFSLRDGGGWSEHTAAIGDNPRNPVFQDGLAGSQVDAAVDDQGRLHMVYQFYYEGCDAMNFRYPDLRYVLVDPANPGAVAVEETVEGNDYEGANTQNSVGSPAALVLDSSGQPVVFYQAEFADGTQGLRVARKVDGQWVREWLAQNLEVGHLSATRAADGTMAVAYYVKPLNDGSGEGDFLAFARQGVSGWVTENVDDSSHCGNHCSLAFDSTGQPVIAYHDQESGSGYARKDLKLARREGASWAKEVVAASGDIGHFNHLWFDDQGSTQILTYSNTDKTIYLFRK